MIFVRIYDLKVEPVIEFAFLHIEAGRVISTRRAIFIILNVYLYLVQVKCKLLMCRFNARKRGI
jgi:hypothetical protein